MKKKLISILILLPLFMSCKTGNETIPLPTPSPSVSIQPSTSPTESPKPTPTVTPTVIPSSPVPTYSSGGLDVYMPKMVIVSGRVYDQNGNLVNGAKVESKLFRPDGIINKDVEYTLDGTFVIRGILLEPYNEIKGEITVSKEGYKPATRTVTVKFYSVITEEQYKSGKLPNTFNFGGAEEEAQYALVKIE